MKANERVTAAPAASAEPVATIHVDGSFVHVEWKVPMPTKCHMDVYANPRAASAEPVSQYFQRVAGCPTHRASDAECICWHDKGTGPHPDARVGDIYNGVTLTWRIKPAAPVAAQAPQDDALTIADYEEVLTDHRRLVRELDVLLNGDGAAQQASLCDIVSQVRRERIKAQAPAANGDLRSANINTLRALVAYLREEADFNRSWTDGRRGGPANPRDEYVKRRLELAARSDGWADQVEALLVAAPSPQGDAPRYRLLAKGDIIQRGDEFIDDDCVSWNGIAGWERGMRYDPAVLKAGRRRIDAASSTPASKTEGA